MLVLFLMNKIKTHINKIPARFIKNSGLPCIIAENNKLDITTADNETIFPYSPNNPPQIPVRVILIKYNKSHFEYISPNNPITSPDIPPQMEPFLKEM